MSDTFEQLKLYFESKLNIDPSRLTRESSLLHDLELRGDDVDQFIGDLIVFFNIEVKELDLQRFFLGDEPFDFISPVVRLIKGSQASKMPTILLGDIERFIDTGVLIQVEVRASTGTPTS